MMFRKPLPVTRYAQGTLVDGYFQEGATTTFNIMASVQPMNSHDMESLPEGRRNGQSYTLFTDSLLFLVTASNPDRVTIDSEEYELHRKSPWQNGVRTHYKYSVVKVLEE